MKPQNWCFVDVVSFSSWLHFQVFCSRSIVGGDLFIYQKNTLPKTNIAPENRPGPKRKRSSSNHHPFSGANC